MGGGRRQHRREVGAQDEGDGGAGAAVELELGPGDGLGREQGLVEPVLAVVDPHGCLDVEGARGRGGLDDGEPAAGEVLADRVGGAVDPGGVEDLDVERGGVRGGHDDRLARDLGGLVGHQAGAVCRGDARGAQQDGRDGDERGEVAELVATPDLVVGQLLLGAGALEQLLVDGVPRHAEAPSAEVAGGATRAPGQRLAAGR